MRSRVVFLAVLLVSIALLATTSPLADEGNIPIFRQTTITEPGHYIVTRDFSPPSGYAITISTDNVTVDLNSHTLSGGIWLAGTDISASIMNGKLIGNVYNDTFTCVRSLTIEKVEMQNVSVWNESGCSIGPVRIRITHSRTGEISLSSEFGASQFAARILDNTVSGEMYLLHLVDSHVSRNSVTSTGNGITLLNSSENVVESNVVSGSGGSGTNGITISGLLTGAGGVPSNNLIIGNVVRQSGGDGIYIGGDRNRIERNMVNSSDQGIVITGSALTPGFQNHLEENQAQGNSGCGIKFENGNGHVFRNNNVIANGIPGITGACGGDLGSNTDAGGNII